MSVAASSGRSRLPTPKSSTSGLGNPSPTVFSGVTRHNTLPSIRSLRKAFQFSNGSGSTKDALQTIVRPSASENRSNSAGIGRADGGSQAVPGKALTRNSSGNVPTLQSSSRLALANGDPPSQSRLPAGASFIHSNLPRAPSPLELNNSGTGHFTGVSFDAGKSNIDFLNSNNGASNSNNQSPQTKPLVTAVPTGGIPKSKSRDGLDFGLRGPTPTLVQLAQEDGLPLENDNRFHPTLFVRDRQTSTPPPTLPLPPLPTAIGGKSVDMQSSLSLSDSETESRLPVDPNYMGNSSAMRSLTPNVSNAGRNAENDQTLSLEAPRVDEYALTYMRHVEPSAIDAIRAISMDSGAAGQSGQAPDSPPILMESPSRSPAVVEANNFLSFESADHVKHDDAHNRFEEEGNDAQAGQPFKDEKPAQNGLRRSSSSPLSELVARLSEQANRAPNVTAEDEDLSPNIPMFHDDQSSHENDDAEMSASGSPFNALAHYGDEVLNRDEDSADGSSGISAASPSK